MVRVFPAHAGVILLNRANNICYDCFPRTRGGDPVKFIRFDSHSMFSPHTRG